MLFMVTAEWALAAEAEFVLFLGGIGIAALTMRSWRPSPAWRHELRILLLVVLLASIASVLQGGTITEMARGLIGKDAPQPLVDTESGLPFMLRIPPAVVSSHLGELRLTSPGELLIAAFELGPLVILLFVLLYRFRHWQRKGRFLLASIFFASLLGFLLPLFLRYRVDRDITRMTNFALYCWLLLGWMVWVAIRRASGKLWFQRGLMAVMIISSFAGVVVLGSLMTAIPKPVFADGIDPIDAAMTRDLWNVLPEGSLILDSDAWRAVTVTGRLTRSAADSYTTLESWEKLRSDPNVYEVKSHGFDFVYVDRYWWDSMPQDARRSFSAPCVELVDERSDNGANGARWLYDLSRCAP